MSNIKQEILFNNSGLNTDDNYAFIDVGDSPYRLNVMVAEDASYGVITNLKGNKQIIYSEPLTLSNCYFALGGYYNALQRRLYFMVMSQPYNSGGGVYLYDNRVLCYREDIGDIITIFRDSKNYLGLDPKEILTDIKMIESWLFYNPVTSEPRMIDVTMAYNYTFYPVYDDTDLSFSAVLGDIYTYKGGLFVANTTITSGQDPVNNATKWDRIGDSYQDESTITVSEFSKAFFAIKVPPVDRLTYAYASDTTVNNNQVRGKVFRFCHRYQYFDDSYSVCSAHSDITRPVDNEVYNGEKAGNDNVNNYIKIFLSLYSASLVKNIEILFQEIGGDWKRMAVINRQDQSLLDTINYTYNFYNNGSYPTIVQTIPYIIYDAVPRLASAQEIINKNVLCFAGCTEGFNNTDADLIDVTLTPEMVAIDLNYTESVLKRDNIVENDVTYSASYDDLSERWLYTTTIFIGDWYSTLQNGDVYRSVIDGRESTLILTSSNLVSASALATAIVSVLTNATTSGDNIEIIYNAGNAIVTLSRIFEPTSVLSSLTKKGTFKSGAYHPFCRFYYDEALRRGDAQVNDDMNVYVPSINEYSPPVTTTEYRWQINWVVEDAPPSWAKYWKWGYAGNRRTSKFVQYIISEIGDGSAVVNNSVYVDITPLQTIRTTTTTNWNNYPNSVIPEYYFTEGDRIRFMTQATTPASTDITFGDVVDGIYDFEILSLDETTNKIYVQDFDYATAQFGENTLVEIYTPLKSADALDSTATLTYYEFGNLMPIIKDADGNSVHGGQSQDQSLTASPVAAKGIFEYGDAYVILRTPSKPFSTLFSTGPTSGDFHESMGWSDFYTSDDWDRGKLGLESSIGEVTLNIIRFSNVYLQNTQVNGITTFEANNYKELNDTYGKIVSIVEVGSTLKVYQEKKAASVGIGRVEYQDSSGNITTVGANSVLGTVRYSTTNYGTIFPESIVKNNRYVYGFDPYNGVVWRDAANGIFPISGQYEGTKNGKMVTYFKNKSKAILTSGVDHCNVFFVWDEEFKMLYVVFKDLVDKTNNDTVVFHEPSDRWITLTEMDYTPVGGFNEMLELTYEVVKGFENGIGYEFDEETRFTKFNIGGGLGTSASINLAVSAMQMSISLPAVVVTIVNCPDIPVIAYATDVTGTSFSANWGASATAAGYYLDVATDLGFSYKVSGFDSLDVSNVITYPVTGLTNQTVYYYRVRAYSAIGISASSLSISQRTSTPPITVTATAATAVGVNQLTANWNISSGADGYYLDVATDSGFTSFSAGFNSRDIGNVLTYMVLGLSGATTYYYRVRSYNLHGQVTASSNTITTITLPGVPIATIATGVTETGITANWNAVTGIDGYYLDVATDSGFTAMVSGYSNLDVSNVVTYDVTGLTTETTYYYRVRSYKGAVSSASSNTISQRTSTPPSTVTATAATGTGATFFYANWLTATGAVGYYVDVSTVSNFATFAPGYNNRDVGLVTTYYIRGLVTGTIYYYRVRSYNTHGQVSSSSNTITVTTT